MKEKILLAIYDENKLQKELLHHQFERTGFGVLYSTMNTAELKEYFEQSPVDILLVNGENDLTKLISCFNNLRKRKGNLNVIIYNLRKDLSASDDFGKQKGVELFFVTGGWANLVTLIETFTDHPKREVKIHSQIPVHLSHGNPYYKISENKNYIDILRYLKEGKSARQIAYLLDTSINNVNYHIKKMHDVTGSNTTKMVADAMKAGLI